MGGEVNPVPAYYHKRPNVYNIPISFQNKINTVTFLAPPPLFFFFFSIINYEVKKLLELFNGFKTNLLFPQIYQITTLNFTFHGPFVDFIGKIWY